MYLKFELVALVRVTDLMHLSVTKLFPQHLGHFIVSQLATRPRTSTWNPKKILICQRVLELEKQLEKCNQINRSSFLDLGLLVRAFLKFGFGALAAAEE